MSIVIVGRNDNYGGDFTNRFQNCIDWNTKWLEHHEVSTEVVFVNWNPVPDQPQIMSQIRWPSDRKHVQYRIITVPHEVHQQFVDPDVRDTVPLFEFIAKNVGIRRTLGKHVLCINADVLIHPDIIDFIAQKKLAEGIYCRADRWDYSDVQSLTVKRLYQAGIMLFMKGFSYNLEGIPTKRLYHSVLRGINQARLKWNLWKEKNYHISNKYGFNVVYDNGGYLAHCHASGDFMMMHRNNWLNLKGYPEYTSISTHTDSLFTIIAYSKLKEFVFKYPVFHQAHERRYNWADIKENSKFKKAYELFENVANCVRNGKDIDAYLNSDNWGLKDVRLDEVSR